MRLGVEFAPAVLGFHSERGNLPSVQSESSMGVSQI